MTTRRTTTAMLLAALLCLSAPVAAQTGDTGALFTDTLGTIRFNCNVSATISQPYSSPSRLNLDIEYASTFSGNSAGDAAGTTIIGGVVALAMPRGIELAGDTRLYFVNPATGSEDFMYSAEFPVNVLTAGLEQAMADISGSNPWQIMSGLERLQQQLAPGSSFNGPQDSRVKGESDQHSVAGKTWLLPVDIAFKELVDIFDPQVSAASQSTIKVRFPLELTSEYAGAPLAVYAGGISSGVVLGEVQPGSTPPLFIPLGEMPVAEAEPVPVAGTEAETAGAVDEPAETTSGEDTTPPEPVPALLYANKWIAWESEVLLPQSTAGETGGSEYALPDAGAVMVDLQPQDPVFSPAQPESTTATGPVTGDAVEVGGAQPAPSASQPVQLAAEGAMASESETGGDSGKDVEVQSAGQATQRAAGGDSDAGSASVEVALGTLPDQNIEYRVELKPITGSGSGLTPLPVPPAGGQPGSAAGGGGPSYMDEMVLVEEGYFLIGTANTESAGDQDELPQSSVFLPSYYIDKYPVTNRRFYQFVIDSGYRPEGKWDKYYSKATADLPVRGVTWNDASAYAEYAGKRLPTEAEWEKAARGTDGRLYPWGNNWSSEILPRGELLYDILHAPKAVSPYGAMGMVGVLWQWTSSMYAPYPYDPNVRSNEYVLRGGCFSNGRNIVRCANRYSQPPNVALNTFSFRCAKDVE